MFALTNYPKHSGQVSLKENKMTSIAYFWFIQIFKAHQAKTIPISKTDISNILTLVMTNGVWEIFFCIKILLCQLGFYF